MEIKPGDIVKLKSDVEGLQPMTVAIAGPHDSTGAGDPTVKEGMVMLAYLHVGSMSFQSATMPVAVLQKCTEVTKRG